MSEEEIIAYSSDYQWYEALTAEQKGIASDIYRNHKKYSKKDAKYRWFVRISKLIISALALSATIVLGLRTEESAQDEQVLAGFIISAVVSFVSGVVSYFKFEEYWMRNVKLHIRLNILRDNFRLDALAGRLDNKREKYYRDELERINKDNIDYWDGAEKKGNV